MAIRSGENKRLEQIIAFAGDGRFAEDNETSREFREYLSRVRTVLLIPLAEFSRWLPGMHETITPDRRYWHVRIKRKNGRFTMNRRKGHERIDLTKYLV